MSVWRHVESELLALEDGRLGAERAAAVEAHLAGCLDCRVRRERLREVRAVLGSLPAPVLPAAVHARIRRRLVEPPQRAPHGWRRLARCGAAIATLGVVALVTWRVGRPWIWVSEASTPPSTLERAAQEADARLAGGDLVLDVDSPSPAGIRAFLRAAHAPAVELADSRVEGAGGYRARGAAVIDVAHARTSLVVYQVAGHRVTLLSAPAAAFADAPLAIPFSKRVRHRSSDGLNTLVWSASGQTYAVATDLPNRGEAACLLCHTDPRFARAIAALPH